VKVCKKVFQTKRKEFNSQQHRMVSKEQVQLVKQQRFQEKKEQIKAKPSKPGQKVPKWKAQSEAFRAVVKISKGGEATAEEKQMID